MATLTTHQIADIRNGNFRSGRRIEAQAWLVSNLLRQTGWIRHEFSHGVVYTREHCGRFQELRVAK